MSAFRRLITVVLIAGTAAGLLLSVLQLLAVTPLIHQAEAYEQAEERAGAHADHDHEWQPSDGFERTAYTVIGTVLTGIAFAALLFSVASVLGLRLDARRGLWLGLAGFTCCALAPAFGLPPRPPGVALANVQSAQIWWFATAIATAIGLTAIGFANGSWAARLAGLAVIIAPHLIGVPHTTGSTPVPRELIQHFAVAAVATQGVFWLSLGALGSYLSARQR